MSGPVLIMAGGTGGHIFPGLAVADVLRARQVDVVWMGSSHGMEGRLVPEAGFPFVQIRVRGLRGKSLGTRLLAPLQLLRAVIQALAVLRQVRPRSVLSLGGFAAGPGGLAAWLLRRPLVVHEQNAVPGLTNRLLRRLARRLLCGFPGALGPQSAHVGNPVRDAISTLPEPRQRMADRHEAFRLLILGGSQGAAAVNSVLPETVSLLTRSCPVQVLHQAGERHAQSVREAYARLDIDAEVAPFIADMAQAYGWADLVICRAGALTIAELAAAGLGAVYVPFPYAVDDHQTLNARFMVSAGAGELLPEPALSADTLASTLRRLLNRADLLHMAEAARALARPQAASEVANVLLEVAS